MQDSVRDRAELAEWLAALEVLVEERGEVGAKALISNLASHIGYHLESPFWNTPCQSKSIDVELIESAGKLVRWNAAYIVQYASQFGSEIGGHLSTFASSYGIVNVGQYYFFRDTDLVFYQGHASPGNYASSFLLDQLSLKQLQHFRRESNGEGISSYPHPWLMPSYWQFPTVSMGLGPLFAIYQAKLIKYLEARGLKEKSGQTVYAIMGDGEMDEVESLGALGVAIRERLDNLVFIVNCNLVRLDGPCRGNSQILQELGQYFSGYGWNVIKLVWSQKWLDLVSQDDGYLQSKLSGLNDGDIQSISASERKWKGWLLADEKTASLVKDWKDDDFEALLPGGHDMQLVANAYQEAISSDKPSVILVMTEKGHGLPVASHNTSHNKKSLSDKQLEEFAGFLGLKEELKELDFYHPGKKDKRIQFLHERRKALGGYIPKRRMNAKPLKIPKQENLIEGLKLDLSRPFSTTMGFVRILNILLRDKEIKDRIVPILADEGRTFGMEGLFSKIGIYHAEGQKYVPHDRDQVNYYKESKDGQLIQEGISEAGAMAMWTACGMSYSVHDLPLIPFYAFYSMFGFQRVGDIIYAAADSRSRGFLMGGTAGKTTLGGEGLQHNDGTSLLMASTIPNCKSYDPCFAYELAIIIHQGLVDMYERDMDVFYYITMMNENYAQPKMPKGVEKGIIKGMYCIEGKKGSVDILASGAILPQAMMAADWILHKAGISVRVWSVTSYCELYRDAENAKLEGKTSYLESCLQDSQLIIACSDYVKALPNMISEHVNAPMVALGTDGFGMSDTRAALREYYGLSHEKIAQSTIMAMADMGLIDMVKAKKLVGNIDRKNPLQDDRRKK